MAGARGSLLALRKNLPRSRFPLNCMDAAELRPILQCICVMAGQIEGRPVAFWEVVAMLERTARQHRMAHTRQINQSMVHLHEKPP